MPGIAADSRSTTTGPVASTVTNASVGHLQHSEVDHRALARLRASRAPSRAARSVRPARTPRAGTSAARARVEHRDRVLRRARSPAPGRRPSAGANRPVPIEVAMPRSAGGFGACTDDERLGHDRGAGSSTATEKPDARAGPGGRGPPRRGARREVHRLGLEHTAVEPGADRRGRRHRGRVGDHHRLGPAGRRPIAFANSQRLASCGVPSESARPLRPSVPSSIWDCSAMTRPRRALTSVDDEIVAAGLVLDRDRDPAVGRARRNPGARRARSGPALVRKSMSTIASSANGLNSARNSCAPLTVVPAAKCHCRRRVAGARADARVADAGDRVGDDRRVRRSPRRARPARRSPGCRPRAPTRASRRATSTVFTFGGLVRALHDGDARRARRARSTFAMKIRSSARPPGFDVPSAQYHAVSTAFAAGTRGPSATSSSALVLDEPEPPRSTSAATSRQPTTTTITSRRARRPVSGLTAAPVRHSGGAAGT